MSTFQQSTQRTAPPMIDGQTTILEAAEGIVEIRSLASGGSAIRLEPYNANTFIPRPSCETLMPIDVIEAFLGMSYIWLCENLARYDDPEYIQRQLGTQIRSYVDPAELRGKRLLDFGCGTGASTFNMAAMFPDTEFVGVELSASRIELAQRVLAARKHDNIRFLVSPDPNSLPPGIGTFDYVMLSAVYEHLLPEERKKVMPLIWSGMKFGALFFINQTPYRYFPYEHHTTGLWFVNFLPDGVTHYLARNYSKLNPEVNKSPDWNVHLRGGIRGGTEGEVLSDLRRAADGSRPTVIQPRNGDRAAYWLSCTNPDRHGSLKKMVASTFRLTDRLFGTVPSINMDVVIRKDKA